MILLVCVTLCSMKPSFCFVLFDPSRFRLDQHKKPNRSSCPLQQPNNNKEEDRDFLITKEKKKKKRRRERTETKKKKKKTKDTRGNQPITFHGSTVPRKRLVEIRSLCTVFFLLLIAWYFRKQTKSTEKLQVFMKYVCFSEKVAKITKYLMKFQGCCLSMQFSINLHVDMETKCEELLRSLTTKQLDDWKAIKKQRKRGWMTIRLKEGWRGSGWGSPLLQPHRKQRSHQPLPLPQRRWTWAIIMTTATLAKEIKKRGREVEVLRESTSHHERYTL